MKTTLREMRPSDVPAIEELLKEQNQRDKTDFPLPLLFDAQGRRMPRIPLALSAVSSSGEIIQGHVFEQTLEQMAIGIDSEATVCSMHEQAAVYYLLRERGFHDVHLFVPKVRLKQMQHGLDHILRMKPTGNSLKHFYRLLDPEQNELMRKWYEDRGV
jgi:hypothetical protein